MIPLKSVLEELEGPFVELDRLFNEEGFFLGGGYEYDHGYYDKALDWEENKEHRAYLRIPVTAVEGSIGTRKATLRIGRPFVLKHEYQTEMDDHANSGLVSGTFNQFTEPANKDADVEDKWLKRGQSELLQLEHRFRKKFRQ
ncbi:YugN-like protein [Melghirimyces profundicolus]|uniref:YugN-like protein n=1 Tax=Melghirimyces profundicolus TaxID=1242148 RepID=A0A2T6ASM5_9BACL|nr:YugN family protein [Melghirimyces profundicolus]PTX46746.1 YugN-like protein [Melghirimyces profundicolus]